MPRGARKTSGAQHPRQWGRLSVTLDGRAQRDAARKPLSASQLLANTEPRNPNLLLVFSGAPEGLDDNCYSLCAQ